MKENVREKLKENAVVDDKRETKTSNITEYVLLQKRKIRTYDAGKNQMPSILNIQHFVCCMCRSMYFNQFVYGINCRAHAKCTKPKTLSHEVNVLIIFFGEFVDL